MLAVQKLWQRMEKETEEKMKKRMLVIADLHCGHHVGLMPNNFRDFKGTEYPQNEQQVLLWNRFVEKLEPLRPFDICLLNGDAIDGRGEKSGSTEVWTADRNVQIRCAGEILRYINADHYLLTHGTRYHVGFSGEDFEDNLAQYVSSELNKDCRIKSQAFIDINGLKIHAKHKINSSSIPHGRFTALARQRVWNLFWSEHGEAPRCNIFIRSHVHYYDYCGGFKWHAVITPALQGWGTKFGNRECEGTIDWGFLVFDIWDQETWDVIPVVDRNTQQVEIVDFNQPKVDILEYV
jgi:hypothetical protein